MIINDSPVFELSVYFAVQKLLKNCPTIKSFIYPYEEKGLERAILKASHEVKDNLHTVGCAHAVHSTCHLYMRRRPSHSINSPKPNIIAATGINAKKWLIDWAKIPSNQIQVIGTNRYQHPLPLRKNYKDRSNPLRILLVIGLWHELGIFVNYLEDIPSLFDDCELWIRKYPYAWIKSQNHAIAQIRKKVKNIRTAEASLSKQFEWSDVVIFSSTSAGIEAMLSGRYTINVELHDLIKIDPLENKGDFSKVIHCSSPEELKNALKVVKNMNQKEFLDSIKNQIDFAKQIYSPVNQNIVKEIITC